jgi:hypothetical protein
VTKEDLIMWMIGGLGAALLALGIVLIARGW